MICKLLGIPGAVVLLLLATACTRVERDAPPADLLAVEKAAQAYKPQRDMALLYVISDTVIGDDLPVTIDINDEPVLLGANLSGRFYVYCLLPGYHEIKINNERERIEMKAGDIVTRAAHVYFGRVLLLMSSTTRVTPIETAYAAPMIAEKRIGSNETYRRSKYRCRTLE